MGLIKVGVLRVQDCACIVLQGFAAYMKTMRTLQDAYLLEPAGSHGVWGLDDYHCLPFLFGAAQLVNHATIKPSSVHELSLLEAQHHDYLYLSCILTIRRTKIGAPFSETSPMLNDISNMHDWLKVCNGLLRLFQGEVLFKLPVVQHLLFGSFLSMDPLTLAVSPNLPTSVEQNSETSWFPQRNQPDDLKAVPFDKFVQRASDSARKSLRRTFYQTVYIPKDITRLSHGNKARTEFLIDGSKVEAQTLLDSGATRNFVKPELVKEQKF